ncbi:MAG: tRNA (adenosine(37)-N6)-dimethylallyltransferase MiaA [Nitrospirae bacterium]|nr:tRNA (adenosine(37)-N6)-dimethylallyltransferase MiaA [Nitrospirota bacterium]
MQNMNSPLLVIVGPTASGKSRLAMELADESGSEIISADSRLIYRGMTIGTAKPSIQEMNRVKHHMIDLIDPDRSYSVGEYRKNVEEILGRETDRASSPPFILTGGTGLYVKAVLYGLWDGPPADRKLRETLLLREEESKGVLYRELCEADALSSSRIHPNDLSKIIRAIEVYYLTGRPLSSFHSEHRFRVGTRPFRIIGLRIERNALYRRIEARVDQMIRDGWIEEVESLIKNGYHEKLPAMRSLGYDTLSAFLKGSYSRPQAIQLIKQETRNYAKRQMTWFNKDRNIQWLDQDQTGEWVRQFRQELFFTQNCQSR